MMSQLSTWTPVTAVAPQCWTIGSHAVARLYAVLRSLTHVRTVLVYRCTLYRVHILLYRAFSGGCHAGAADASYTVICTACKYIPHSWLFVPLCFVQVVAALEGLTRGDSDVFHAAVDAVCELVWCTVDPETAAVQPAMMPLIQVRCGFAVTSRALLHVRCACCYGALLCAVTGYGACVL